jgi:hypothetical protein
VGFPLLSLAQWHILKKKFTAKSNSKGEEAKKGRRKNGLTPRLVPYDVDGIHFL